MALVTGASVGIGAATARALVQQGMRVVGCARNVDKIEVGKLNLLSLTAVCVEPVGHTAHRGKLTLR